MPLSTCGWIEKAAAMIPSSFSPAFQPNDAVANRDLHNRRISQYTTRVSESRPSLRLPSAFEERVRVDGLGSWVIDKRGVITSDRWFVAAAHGKKETLR
jgi:hypothetical protein